MALRFLEGFESATVGEVHARVYEEWNFTSQDNLTSVDGAHEGFTGAPSMVGASADEVSALTKPIVASNQNSWIIGIAVRANSTQGVEGASAAYVGLENDDGEQIRIEFDERSPATTRPEGGVYYGLRVMRGATELCSSDQKFFGSASSQHWVYFEFKVTIDNSSGSVEGRYHYVRKHALNPSGGYTALTWDAANTSIDTQNQTSTGANRFSWSLDTGNTADFMAFDDIYVCDSTGAKNNDYVGKIHITEIGIESAGGGDGNTTEWTLSDASSTFNALHENPNATDDDARITSDTTSQVHLAALESSDFDILSQNSTILGWRMDVFGRMETSGDLDIAHMWRKTTATAAETNSGSFNVDSTTIKGSAVVLEDDPNTATDWDPADMDSYEFGVRNDG